MRTWIFQAHPDRFDIDAFLATHPGETTWLVTRLGDQMHVGDEVYFWRAIGSGEASSSGIIAKAELTGEVQPRADDPASAKFWRSTGEATEIRDRALLRILRVANKKEVLQRSWLAEDPILRDLQILKMSNATNFAVDPHHAVRLDALWEKAGKDWSYAETLAGLWAYAHTYGGEVSKRAGSPVAEIAVKIGRSIGSAYNKVMNFRSLDPRDTRKGLDGASEMDRTVWAEYFDGGRNALDETRLNSEMVRLWPSGAEVAPLDELEALDAGVEKEARKLLSLGLAELEAIYARGATARARKPRARRSSTRTFERDPLVVAIAKARAGFRCEVPECGHPLFLDGDGRPFCEVHHIHPLAEGGPDTPGNAACVCPSHHREAHHGKRAREIREALEQVRSAEAASASAPAAMAIA